VPWRVLLLPFGSCHAPHSPIVGNPNKPYYNALLPPLMPIAPIILNILQADLAQITN